MKPGDLVKFKCSVSSDRDVVQYGTFIGIRKFDSEYECAEVMWHNKTAPNGKRCKVGQAARSIGKHG